jgi:hypothetical protein
MVRLEKNSRGRSIPREIDKLEGRLLKAQAGETLAVGK